MSCHVVLSRTALPSKASNVDDGLGKGLRGFLWQIVTHPTIDRAVRIISRKFLGVSGGFGVWCTIGIAFERDGGYRDVGPCRQVLLQILVPGLALGKSQPPAIIVNDDGDMIRIVESGRTALERSLIEVPFR